MTEFQLTPGSTYRVLSVKTREDSMVTEGRFVGMTSMGSIDALVLEVGDEDDPDVELVPTHVVLKLEVLEASPEEGPDEDESTMHYT